MALISTLPLFGTTLTIIVKASLYPQSSQDERFLERQVLHVVLVVYVVVYIIGN